MSRRGRLGLIVNPIAGIGGAVALKGSDGLDTVELARRLGAEPIAPHRAVQMLKALYELAPDVELATYPREMGEVEAVEAGFEPHIVGTLMSSVTSAADTVRAAQEMKRRSVELIMFVGGDGTARNVLQAVNGDIPVVGVPAGVKLHSSVFATNPRRAAEIVGAFVEGSTNTRELEVMDIDETEVRAGRLSARIYGYLSVPDQPRLLQGSKTRSQSNTGDLSSIAARIVADMDDHVYYGLGPGTTVRAITEHLGIGKTLLGVDVVHRRKLVGSDVTEAELYRFASRHSCVIVVGVVGGQGYILGRGNQQVSPRVIRAIGRHNLVVVATLDKLHALNGPLRVDTGDTNCDRDLSGYRRVITGRFEESIWMVET